MENNSVAPHAWARKGWRFWLCRHCLGPRPFHPTQAWYPARSLKNNLYLSVRVWRRSQGNI